MALGMLWWARRGPRVLPLLLVDAPGALIATIMCIGLALAYAVQPVEQLRARLRVLGLALLACSAALTALPFGMACLLVAAGGLAGALRWRRPLVSLPLVIAALAAVVGGLALGLRGAARYDDPAAGAALDSLVFFFSLLAGTIACLPLAEPEAASEDAFAAVVRLAWLLPLLRLLTLGPWNTGWSLAATLLGGAAALWAALAALARPAPHARVLAGRQFFLGLALASMGLASSAGIAAACYALACYVVLCVAPTTGNSPRWVAWALSGAFPLSAPFVACWMAIGAAAAAGAMALAGAIWLAALLRGLAGLLAQPSGASHPGRLAAIGAIVLGVLAPTVVGFPIQLAVDQLQGGLTPYGNLSITPWVGLALLDSGSRAMITAPTLVVAGLMLVLAALLVLLTRLWPEQFGVLGDASDDTLETAPKHTDLIGALAHAVPWLAGLDVRRDRRDDAS
jgi:hypothetical protein